MKYCSLVSVTAALLFVWHSGAATEGASAVEPATKPTTQPAQSDPPQAVRHMVGFLGGPLTWDQGSVSLVRVSEAKSREGQAVPGFWRLATDEDFGDTAAPAEMVIPAGLLQTAGANGMEPKGTGPGDLLLLWVSTGARRPNSFEAISVAPKERDGLVASLKLIQDYRKAVGSEKAKAAEAMLRAKKDIPVQYLCQELGTGKHDLPDQQRPLLLEARDDRSLYVSTRLEASETLHRYDHKYKDGREHVAWIRQWFDEPGALSYGDCNYLLSQLRTYAEPKDFEALDLPTIAKIFSSSKTGDEEALCALNWVAFSCQLSATSLDVHDKVVRILLDEAFKQEDGRKAVNFLKATFWGIGHFSPQGLRAKHGPQEDVAKAGRMLKDYEGILTDKLKSAKDAEVRLQIQSLLHLIKSVSDEAPG